MSAVVVIVSLLLFYFLGYRGWSSILATKVFNLREDEPTPAHNPELRDDVDYMPVNKHILWGHHYTSIAGAAPIIGPAVAIIWGWVPALLWVVLGTIFIGAVHDFGALVISARHNGRTMADLSGHIITPRVRLLFQIIIYFLIWIVLAVFGVAIGVLFTRYPATVIPINFEIIVAIVIGFLFYKKKVPILIPSILALVALYAMVAVGLKVPVTLAPAEGIEAVGWIQAHPVETWALALLAYSAIASVLPVWVLLQPRDYINSHQLIVGLSALILGLIVLHPPITAPAINLSDDLPPIIPFIFVTIACGAISGFHGLVSSGTTSKQLDKMTDARAIGYGGMLGEGSLAVMATVAVAAGLDDWHAHYHSFNGNGINAIANFVAGAGTFLEALNFNPEWAAALVAVLAISFAATSMDTGARIQRLVVTEFGEALNIGFLKNRYIATLIAVAPAVPLVLAGKAVWGPLWMLFGTTNQLIGGMTFMVLFVYLFKSAKPILYYVIPMIFVVTVTTLSMVMNLHKWIGSLGSEAAAPMITIVIGAIILLLEIWMIIEALIVVKKLRAEKAA